MNFEVSGIVYIRRPLTRQEWIQVRILRRPDQRLVGGTPGWQHRRLDRHGEPIYDWAVEDTVDGSGYSSTPAKDAP